MQTRMVVRIPTASLRSPRLKPTIAAPMNARAILRPTPTGDTEIGIGFYAQVRRIYEAASHRSFFVPVPDCENSVISVCDCERNAHGRLSADRKNRRVSGSAKGPAPMEWASSDRLVYGPERQ